LGPKTIFEKGGKFGETKPLGLERGSSPSETPEARANVGCTLEGPMRYSLDGTHGKVTVPKKVTKKRGD